MFVYCCQTCGEEFAPNADGEESSLDFSQILVDHWKSEIPHDDPMKASFYVNDEADRTSLH